MLKSGLEIDFGVMQKHYAVIFEILIFQGFSGGQNSNFCHIDKILDFDPLRNSKKSKFQKSQIFASPLYLSQNQISASADL